MENIELKSRHDAEIEFHDKKYSVAKHRSIYDLGFTDIIFNSMMMMIGDLRQKKILDFGCGSGWLTKLLLEKGATVYAFDISPEAVKLTQKEAQSINKADMLDAQAMPAEKLIYEDNFFDMVIGVGILHHLDIRLAAQEIFRVLKPSGIAYFMEPLAYNPLINFYRKITPEIRSIDEQPLRSSDFTILENIFSDVNHEEYYLFVLISLFWYYGIKNEKMLELFRNLLFKADTIFLKKFNKMKKFCWYTIIKMHK